MRTLFVCAALTVLFTHVSGGASTPVYTCSFDSAEAVWQPGSGTEGAVGSAATFVAGVAGNAMRVPAGVAGASVDLPAGLLGAKGCLEFWAKIDKPASTYSTGGDPRFFNIIFENGAWFMLQFASNNGAGNSGVDCWFPAGGLVSRKGFGYMLDYSTVFGTAAYDDWHHWAVVWNRDGVRSLASGDKAPGVAVLLDGAVLMSADVSAFDSAALAAAFSGAAKLYFPLSPSDDQTKNKSAYLIDEFRIWDEDRTTFTSEPPTLTLAGYEGVYDGTGHGVRAGGTGLDGARFGYALSAAGPFVDELLFTNVCDAVVWCRALTAEGLALTNSAAVRITPRPVSLKSASARKRYDGEPLRAESVSVTSGSFVAGETLLYTFGDGQTDAGTSDNSFAMTAGPNTQVENYAVTCAYGTLTVDLGVIGLVGGEAREPVYSCSFDSAEAVLQSGFGSTGSVAAAATFVAGVAGHAMRVPAGVAGASVDLPAGLLGEKGCLEFWAKIDKPASTYSTGGDPRFFNIIFENGAWFMFQFASNNGAGNSGVDCWFPAGGLVSRKGFGYMLDYSTVFGTSAYDDWHHWAVVWNRDGVRSLASGAKAPGVAVLLDGAVLMSADVSAFDSAALAAAFSGAGKLYFPLSPSDDQTKNKSAYLIDEFRIWDDDGMVSAGPSAFVAVEDYDGVYDGAGHIPALDCGALAGAAVRYALSAEGPYVDDLLFTNACERTVWWEVSAPNYEPLRGTASLRISMGTNCWTVAPSIADSWEFGEAASRPVAAARFGEVEVSYSPFAPASAGDYVAVFRVAGTADYGALETSVPFRVTPKSLRDGMLAACEIRQDANGTVRADAVLSDGGRMLESGVDYEMKQSVCAEGVLEVAFAGIGNYAGGFARTYPIGFTPGFEGGGSVDAVTPVPQVPGRPWILPPVPSRPGYDFLGWFRSSGERVAAGDIVRLEDVDETLVAGWAARELLEGDAAFSASTVARLYDGYLLDGEARMAGTLSVTVGRVNARTGVSVVRATVATGSGEKFVFQGSTRDGMLVLNADGHVLDLEIGARGLRGAFDDSLVVRGAINAFRTKNGAGVRALDAVRGTYAVALETESATGAGASLAQGAGGVVLTVGNKGSVTAVGVLGDGVRISGSGQLLFGADGLCIPVLIAHARGRIGFLVWFSPDGLPLEVSNPSEWVVPGRHGSVSRVKPVLPVAPVKSPSGQFHFRLGGDVPDIDGRPAVADLLPEGQVVFATGAWDAGTAGKVRLPKGTATPVAEGVNPSALKLVYSSGKGTFTGSFFIYTVQGDSLMKTRASISGIVVDGVGYGSAVVKDIGSVPVFLEPVR